jgi:hypothetical protein
MESLTNFTLPSAKRVLTPPGWALVAGNEMLPLSLWLGLPCGRQTLNGNWWSFGVWPTLKIELSEAELQR